ncbi:MAG: cyclic nucleotide-binding domain-containing protein [Methylococcales bacterium]|jgi:CRP-like cAMP-binding protein|nr:cyclic nucleotide-binding domain-containing protein [Methylococcales bacterium]
MDEIIINEGEMGHSFFILDSGEIKVCKNTPQDVQLISTLNAHAAFGEMALVCKNPRVASVIAQSDVLVGEITWKNFENLMQCGHQCIPRIILNIAQVLSQRLLNFNQQFCLLDKKVSEIPDNSTQQTVTSELDSFKNKLFSDWSF